MLGKRKKRSTKANETGTQNLRAAQQQQTTDDKKKSPSREGRFLIFALAFPRFASSIVPYRVALALLFWLVGWKQQDTRDRMSKVVYNGIATAPQKKTEEDGSCQIVNQVRCTLNQMQQQAVALMAGMQFNPLPTGENF